MYKVWYDDSLSNFDNPVWRIGEFGIGYDSKEIAEFESIGFERKHNKQTSCICGFCEHINGEYKAHFINNKGKEIIKPLYNTQYGYMVKNGKSNYFLTDLETKWFDAIK